jgi:hypothetical protein
MYILINCIKYFYHHDVEINENEGKCSTQRTHLKNIFHVLVGLHLSIFCYRFTALYW